MADERNFPDVQFEEIDTDQLAGELQEAYETLLGRTLSPADPERLRLLWFVSIIAQERSRRNIMAMRNLPRYATGDYLDSLAELFYDVQRLPASPASVTMLFTLSEAQDKDLTIIEGTEITNASGTVTFATVEDLVISAGKTSGTVLAECEEAGEVGNGYASGKLNVVIDMVAWLESAENIDESNGGAEEESDDSLYERMKDSLEAYSTAGTSGAYEYHARSFNARIEDVVTASSVPGRAEIYFLLSDGEIPDDNTVQEMQDYLSSDEIRPLTDLVIVRAPEAVTYKVELIWYSEKGSNDDIDAIGKSVQEAVTNYITWQSRKIGRKINPSKLTALVVAAGAAAVDISEPKARSLDTVQVGQCESVSVTYGGEDA